MKKWWDMLLLIIIGITVLLELYPKGVAVSRMAAPGEHFIDYFSYFNLTPYWSENKYPLRTGILSCILFIFTLLKLMIRRKILDISILVIDTLAIIFSIFAVYSQYENIFGYSISVFLILFFVFAVIEMFNNRV